MSDPTEGIRRQMVLQMEAALAAVRARGDQFWDTEQFREEFEARAFLAPFVEVVRKSDGATGTLMFTHHPRFYFGWEANDAA